MNGAAVSLVCALAIAAVSTVGDFVWATWISRPRAIHGLVHGTLLFLFIGLALGMRTRRPASGALGGALIGGLGAAGYYVLAPLTGYWVMFVVWIAIWMALGLLNGQLNQQSSAVATVARGGIAAVASGIAFYLISGIWLSFDPHGWDYLVHFGAWTIAYLPGFAALLVEVSPARHKDQYASS